MKHQIPNTNNQVMIKLPRKQYILVIVIWSLDIIWKLGFGNWNFKLGQNKRHVYFEYPNRHKRRG